MKHIIIGTAGHIDHGKTVLTRALTGVDTDRLPEEKEREMSIDLGFAPFPLTDDLTASIVDVPGHEKFIKNMVAGVSGVDLILFVVAADDGIMPQTREHLQILELLGLSHGSVVITKLDLVSPDRVRQVENDIMKLAENTFLERCPIVKVSAPENTGIVELREEICRIAQRIEPRRPDRILRLPVDRVFTMPGFGTVITGTVISGSVTTGQEVEILPEGKRVRVRAIQAHQSLIPQAVAGQRTALNLKDVGKEDLSRGDVITAPGILSSTARLDVKLRLLDALKKPLKHLTRVRFHVGTNEIMGRVALLEPKELRPGQETYAQVRLEKPVVALKDDRFIVRSYSPQLTIGGGVILDAYPAKHRRRQPGVVENLSVLESSEEQVIIEAMLKINSPFLTRDQLIRLTNLPPAEIDRHLELLNREGRVVSLRNRIVHTELLGECKQEILKKIDVTFGDRIYISRGEFAQSLSLWKDPVIVEGVLKQLETDQIVQVKSNRVKLLARADGFSDWRSKIEEVYRNSHYHPPGLADVQSKVGVEAVSVKDLVSNLVEDGILTQVAPGMVFHREAVEESIQILKNHLKSHPGITVSEFRKLLGTSRKYAVPLLEYLDSIAITVRDGDVRRLKG